MLVTGPTIQEIARKAGVSHTTVSAVLNNRGSQRRISQSTQDHILSVAKELRYTPNMLARGLRGGKTQTIGMILSGLHVEATTAKIMMIEKVAAQQGYRICACYHDGDLEREKRDIRELVSRQVDGLIAYPVDRTDGAHYQQLMDQKFPMVIAEREFLFPTNCVLIDLVEVGLLAVRHLVEIGRKKIAFIGGGLKAASNQARIKGWQQGCQEAGLDFWTMPFFSDDMGDSPEDAYRLAKQLLASKHPFDAVIASNDIFAIAIMKVLQEHGLKIPIDVAIVGLDDDRFTRYLPTPLTTIRQPVEELGETVVKMLLSAIENPSRPFERVVLRPQLLARESTIGRV
jgi:LacI family transcriptional regulator